MPQVFKIGSYWVYFWSNWITSCGKCLLAHNNSQIPEKALKNIMRVIEARSEDVISKWLDFFDEIEYYC